MKTFFSLNRSNRASKNLSFRTDFKNVHMTLVKSAPKKSFWQKSPKKAVFWAKFFWVHFLQRSYVHFWNQYEKTDFLIPHLIKKKKFHLIVRSVFGTDPDRNRALEETPRSWTDSLPSKATKRTRTLRDPAQTQVWREQVWLDITFISQGSRSWGKLAVETWRVKTELIIIITILVRHRLGPEWDAWRNPQQWNWFLPLIKPLRRTRTLCDPAQTQVWSESSVVEHNLFFARLAIVG